MRSQSFTRKICFTNPQHWLGYCTRNLYNESGWYYGTGTYFTKLHYSMAQIRTSNYHSCIMNKIHTNVTERYLMKVTVNILTCSSGLATAPPMGTMKRMGIFFWPISRKSINAWRESELRITMPEIYLVVFKMFFIH